MFAATASATCLPALSLIAFATSSQTCCLREEITTLAPCSAIRSAMARPMPREDPVMTATFPDISNSVIASLPVADPAAVAPVLIFELSLSSREAKWLCELAGDGDLRPGRLMHRVMRGVRDPWLLVDHGQPPVAVTVCRKMVEPRHRTIVDVEGEAFFRQAAKRETDRGLDGAAVRDGDNIPARMFDSEAVDRALYAIVEIHETLAARRGLVDRGKPVAAGRAAGEERGAMHALPSAEMLFGQRIFVRHGRRLWKSGGPDRIRGLMRTLQRARDPGRLARQDFADRLEHRAIAGVAAEILLSV